MGFSMLNVQYLTIHFPLPGGGTLTAVNNVSFRVEAGQTTGLVGESGSGKTTIGRAILGIQPVAAGDVLFEPTGQNLVKLTDREWLPLRKEIQMIFQDPYGSLNPRWTIKQILDEPQDIHFRKRSKSERVEVSASLLEKVGLSPDMLNRRPHEFSGGQRQRIGIARALAVEPKLIVCDEAVSALDVSVQASIINLLQDLQEEFGIAYLFIGHDLAVVRHISHRVVVLQHGCIVEQGTGEELYTAPQHPYTQQLLAAAAGF